MDADLTPSPAVVEAVAALTVREFREWLAHAVCPIPGPGEANLERRTHGDLMHMDLEARKVEFTLLQVRVGIERNAGRKLHPWLVERRDRFREAGFR